MQKENWFFFSLSSGSIFDNVRDTNKREQKKIIYCFFMPSESIFDKVKDTHDLISETQGYDNFLQIYLATAENTLE